MKNTADVTGGKLVVVCSHLLFSASAVNSLVAFNDSRRQGGLLLFSSVLDATKCTHNILVNTKYCISLSIVR
jgi:hypothetical protein